MCNTSLHKTHPNPKVTGIAGYCIRDPHRPAAWVGDITLYWNVANCASAPFEPSLPQASTQTYHPLHLQTIYGVSSKGQVKMSMTNIDFECIFFPLWIILRKYCF